GLHADVGVTEHLQQRRTILRVGVRDRAGAEIRLEPARDVRAEREVSADVIEAVALHGARAAGRFAGEIARAEEACREVLRAERRPELPGGAALRMLRAKQANAARERVGLRELRVALGPLTLALGLGRSGRSGRSTCRTGTCRTSRCS